MPKSEKRILDVVCDMWKVEKSYVVPMGTRGLANTLECLSKSLDKLIKNTIFWQTSLHIKSIL